MAGVYARHIPFDPAVDAITGAALITGSNRVIAEARSESIEFGSSTLSSWREIDGKVHSRIGNSSRFDRRRCARLLFSTLSVPKV